MSTVNLSVYTSAELLAEIATRLVNISTRESQWTCGTCEALFRTGQLIKNRKGDANMCPRCGSEALVQL